VVVFGLEDRRKKMNFVSSNIPSSMNDQAPVDSMKVMDAKATILLGLIDIFLGAKGNGTGGIVILDSCPPKYANDSVNFLNKGFRKKESWTYSKQEWRQGPI
jgi:hypothetical protein